MNKQTKDKIARLALGLALGNDPRSIHSLCDREVITMTQEEKNKTLSVDIHQLEQFWNTDLHEFKPGGTYPISKLMDALGFFHVHGRPKLRPRGNRK